MRAQLILILPLLAAMLGMLAIVGLNTVDANMTSSKGNYTSGTNATSGNMTSGNATSGNMAGPTNLTSSP
jgi:Flp pilus assembly protein CpaB